MYWDTGGLPESETKQDNVTGIPLNIWVEGDTESFAGPGGYKTCYNNRYSKLSKQYYTDFK